MEDNRTYIAIDLKSFYASVECKERGFDPMNTNLVVADASRTEKTICLAVTPSLKSYGIPGRARLFEVIQKLREVNADRRLSAPGGRFVGSSFFQDELTAHPALEVSYIAAPPRMALYMQYSTRIYDIYLKYIAPEDIHVYSIDEVFMDVTQYLTIYKMSAKELASKIIRQVQEETGIAATAGIGTNLYLCKVALDIMAKHAEPDENGVRIAVLDEMSYRTLLWDHKPLTDFWRVGHGYRKKLEEHGLYTMGDIARCSLGSPRDFHNEELLYRLFGINAELLIDHAWGYEPVTMDLIKSYKPATNCIGSGQVLQHPYSFEKARLIVKEMTDVLVLDLVEKRLVTDQLVLSVGYDTENLKNPEVSRHYQGEVTKDYYGRMMPKHAHGTANTGRFTSSTKLITDAVTELYDKIVNPDLTIRRINITANHLMEESRAAETGTYEQLTLFDNSEETKKQKEAEEMQLSKERKLQEAMLSVKKRYGKNAMLKGMNLEEGAMAKERNNQIGGHKA